MRKARLPGVQKGRLFKLQISGHLTAIAPILKFVFNLLIVRQPGQARAFNRRNMYKYITAAAVGGNKTVTFGGVKPFHGASWHVPCLLSFNVSQTARDTGLLVEGGVQPGPNMAFNCDQVRMNRAKSKEKGMICRVVPDIDAENREFYMQLFGLKTCDTCRKALKSLPAAEFMDVRAKAVPQDVMQRAFECFGENLVNKRSTTWRGLDESERARPPLDLLADHPSLMKRPLIVTGNEMHLGWTADTRAALGVA